MNATIAELAVLIGGEVDGCPDAVVSGVASVDEARPGDVVLAEDRRYLERAACSAAACIVTGPAADSACEGKNLIRVDRPGEAFAKVLDFFRIVERMPAPGIGPGAIVEPDARLGSDVAVGANCYVGHGAVLGDGCVLFPNVYIGDGAIVGEKSKIYPGVVVYANCTVGRRVILHAGVVIGADGFGYVRGAGGLVKLPHVGTVEIGDDVEIGANATVDRAKTGATVVGRGTKIDNLVHIAHNVKIGANCVVAGMSGVAGSTEIGSNVTLAAQVGVKDHVRIGDGAVVAARAGVSTNIDGGAVVSGFPARDHRAELRSEAVRLQLPEVLERLRALERELEGLRGKGETGNDGHV